MRYDEVRSQIEAMRLNRLDVVVFVGAFLAGVTLYAVLHVVLRLPQWAVTVVMISVMLSYAGVAVGVPRLRVRLDQAGDNAHASSACC